MARLTNIARFTPTSQKSEMVSSVCLTSLIQYNSSGSRILLRTYTRFSFVKSIAALIPNSPSLAESASFVIGLRLRSTSPVPGAATTIASFTGHITPTTLLLSSPFLCLSLLVLVVTQIRGHTLGRRLFLPLPTTIRALHFYRQKTSAFSSLVDSRRIAPLPTPGALSS